MSDHSLWDLQHPAIALDLDLSQAAISGFPRTERHLSDLRGVFRDAQSYDAVLSRENPLVYAVTPVEPAQGDGQMHYGLGILYPGKIGDEFFLTKGHYHSHRPAAEIYVGLKGEGRMLLECEESHECRMVTLRESAVVYVPGHTAHRTVNTGSEPLLYLGIYPANAGHDYAAIAQRNFRMVIVERAGRVVMESRC